MLLFVIVFQLIYGRCTPPHTTMDLSSITIATILTFHFWHCAHGPKSLRMMMMKPQGGKERAKWSSHLFRIFHSMISGHFLCMHFVYLCHDLKFSVVFVFAVNYSHRTRTRDPNPVLDFDNLTFWYFSVTPPDKTFETVEGTFDFSQLSEIRLSQTPEWYEVCIFVQVWSVLITFLPSLDKQTFHSRTKYWAAISRGLNLMSPNNTFIMTSNTTEYLYTVYIIAYT